MKEDLTSRAEFHNSIQDILEEEEGVLTGWVVVYETVRPDDQRYLTVMTGDATGENNLTPWTAEGWLAYIANSGINTFETASDDDEDDDEFDEV